MRDGSGGLRIASMTSVLWIRLMALFLVSAGIAASEAFPQHSPLPMQPKSSPAATPVSTAMTPVTSLSVPTSAGTTVTVDGEIVCLPRQAGGQGAQTLECAIGLRTTEGQHYALENINPYIIDGKIAMGQHVKVSGRLRLERGTRYDTIGLINVTSVH
jgi:hypothetical protein